MPTLSWGLLLSATRPHTLHGQQGLRGSCSGGAAATGGGSLAPRAEEGAPDLCGRQSLGCPWAWSTGGGFGAQGHSGEGQGDQQGAISNLLS